MMNICTGARCPMQVGYEVKKCEAAECSYRTPPMTNADRIRNMSDEELAEFLMCEYGSRAIGRALKWLKQPYKERE